ncbi:SH3 domain-containing protein [Stutzerimonas frequens]|uniref:SH3 domain-containing protein n=1 Tax=Stutzerimonas frequens TaxID=2968969 RepID=A0AA47E330_9GAMM|nr:SH3 domain-containing protein [Stutzerimonas frequens]WAE53270.1 SH3 domain-containing protein [Stutzerimonas frequens]
MSNDRDQSHLSNQIREQIESLENRSDLLAIRDRILTMNESPALIELAEQLKAASSGAYLASVSEQLRSAYESPSLASLIEQAKNRQEGGRLYSELLDVLRFSDPPTSILDLVGQKKTASSLARLAASVADVFTSPSVMAAVELAQEIDQQLLSLGSSSLYVKAQTILEQVGQGSPLVELLASKEGDRSRRKVGRLIEAGGIAMAHAYASGDAEVTKGNRNLDAEIAQQLKRGAPPETLSLDARRRALDVVIVLYIFWEVLLRIAATEQVYQQFTSRLEAAGAPIEVREVIQATPEEERLLLAHLRVVNRNGTTLRAEPTTQSDSLASLPLGTPVEVLEGGTKAWVHVLVDHFGEEKKGWIYRSLTTPIPKPRG